MLCCTAAFSQNSPQPCKASEINNKFLEEHTDAFVENHKFNQFSREFQPQTNNSTYIIPVVFHVFGDIHSGKTVTYEKIEVALEKLNDDFNGLNPDFSSVDSYFSNIKSTLDIEFRLAKIDPNGGCTTGVIFYEDASGFGNGSGYDNQIQQYAWDNYKYMNIYVQNDLYNDGSEYNSGVAWYPNTWMSDNDLARVVYNGSYLHGNTDSEFASTLTHEFGHWLNLIHTFEGGCNGTDEVNDTPAEDGYHDLDCTYGYNCSNSYVNVENYMGYNGSSGCYKMFTAGQVTRMEAALNHPTRYPLWQNSNLIDTGVLNETSGQGTFESSISTIFEDDANNGTFTEVITVDLNNGYFSNSSGTLQENTDYTVSAPTGLGVQINLLSSTKAEISFTGAATYHDDNDNTTLEIDFKNNALSGGLSSFSCAKLAYELKYYAPYEIVYVDIDDITITTSYPWEWFTIEVGDDNQYGAFLDANLNDELKIETYQKPLICEGNSLNITYLGEDEPVNGTRNFVDGGPYPDLHNLRSTNYTVWDGQEGYVGFEYRINNRKCYGWFKLSVSTYGDSYTLLEYAYNTAPNQTIYTGYNNSNVSVTDYTLNNEILIYPNPVKDRLQLKLNSKQENVQISIYDLHGKLVKRIFKDKIDGVLEIDTKDMTFGLYNITLESGEEIKLSSKFLKR
ncbi:zinc-dependent metalloprotease [Aureivirga marina]|uniref:zinc-dependent metalloprotease n=1 Tax=Aureivirga marina TaxID=1182451 RepID=UPI0018CA3BC8|nr:zinc-dependent metalloprotease [Aureivirga marina]